MRRAGSWPVGPVLLASVAIVLLVAACVPPAPVPLPPAPTTTTTTRLPTTTTTRPPVTTVPSGRTTLAPGAPDPYVTSGLGEFVARCTLSHRANVDPIVAPGNAAFWHQHDFFGNRSVTERSTVASMLGQPTSCSPAADAAAYWVPTLSRDGVPVDPTEITIYYHVKRPQDPAKVQPLPAGLRIIAGRATATSPQPDHVMQWGCIGGVTNSPTIPNCGSAELQLILQFPDCWDGVNLDSPDHQSHMRYSRGQDCPATHPVLVPKMEFRFRWPVSGPGVRLSSDSGNHPGHTGPAAPTAPGLTGHGDIVNTWDQAELERRVVTCLQAARVCNEAGIVIR